MTPSSFFRFFVISGFLMAKNLTQNPISGVSDILQFYYRRSKRILPLYYLITVITLVLVHFYLGDFFWGTNRRYCLASLFLATNQLIIHDSQDYFSQVCGSALFTNHFNFSSCLTVPLAMPFSTYGPYQSKCSSTFSFLSSSLACNS